MAGIGKSTSTSYTVTLTEEEFRVIAKKLDDEDLNTDEQRIQDELATTFNMGM